MEFYSGTMVCVQQLVHQEVVFGGSTLFLTSWFVCFYCKDSILLISSSLCLVFLFLISNFYFVVVVVVAVAASLVVSFSPPQEE